MTNKSPILALFFGISLMYAGSLQMAQAGTEDKQTAPESRFKIYGWIQSGITVNPADPASHENFGRLFDDRSNEPMLNQLVLTGERTLDPKATGFDWGFKVQALFGSDARYIHSLGLFSNTMQSSIVQPDFPEAYLNLHLPVLTEGGVEVKLGKFVTLEGAETIDPRTNVFYSHSYIFNFGTPLIRGEVWRDAQGFYVVQFAGNHDPMLALEGAPITNPDTVSGGSTTYGAITIGAGIKVPAPKPFTDLVIRPELRYDCSLNNTTPFNDSSDRGMFTAAVSVILSF